MWLAEREVKYRKITIIPPMKTKTKAKLAHLENLAQKTRLAPMEAPTTPSAIKKGALNKSAQVLPRVKIINPILIRGNFTF